MLMTSNQRILRVLALIAGATLLVVGCFKFAAAINGKPGFVAAIDPVFGIPNKFVYPLVGLIECIVGYACWQASSLERKGTFLLIMSASWIIYRVGLLAVDSKAPCSCMSYLKTITKFSDQAIDRIGLAIILYTFVTGLLLTVSGFRLRPVRVEAVSG